MSKQKNTPPTTKNNVKKPLAENISKVSAKKSIRQKVHQWSENPDILSAVIAGFVAGAFALIIAFITGYFTLNGINHDISAQSTRVSMQINAQTNQYLLQANAQATETTLKINAQDAEIRVQATLNAEHLRTQLNQEIVIEQTRTSAAIIQTQVDGALEIIANPDNSKSLREYGIFILENYGISIPIHLREAIKNGVGYIDLEPLPPDYGDNPYIGGYGGNPPTENTRQLLAIAFESYVMYTPFSEE